MRDYERPFWTRVLIRLGIVLGAFALAALAAWAGGSLIGLLFLAFAFALAAVIFGPLLAEYVATPMGSLFYPTRALDHAPPAYGIAESKVKQGAYEEAMRLYEETAQTHPDELKPYVDMIEIAVKHLRDPQRAGTIYERGLRAPLTPQHREALTRMYLALLTTIADKPTWQRPRTLPSPPPGLGRPGRPRP